MLVYAVCAGGYLFRIGKGSSSPGYTITANALINDLDAYAPTPVPLFADKHGPKIARDTQTSNFLNIIFL